jgi:hypothetical protein
MGEDQGNCAIRSRTAEERQEAFKRGWQGGYYSWREGKMGQGKRQRRRGKARQEAEKSQRSGKGQARGDRERKMGEGKGRGENGVVEVL